MTKEKYKLSTKIMTLNGNSLTQNEKRKSLNLKAKLKYQKWFVIVDNWATTNFMTR